MRSAGQRRPRASRAYPQKPSAALPARASVAAKSWCGRNWWANRENRARHTQQARCYGRWHFRGRRRQGTGTGAEGAENLMGKDLWGTTSCPGPARAAHLGTSRRRRPLRAGDDPDARRLDVQPGDSRRPVPRLATGALLPPRACHLGGRAVGLGKSHLAQALGCAACQQGD